MKYSIVIPVYNSASGLEELCSRIHDAMQSHSSFEIVLVDDGSTDDSWNKLRALKAKHSSTLKIVRLSKNFGQHNALSCGFTVAGGEYLITMDDDLQHPPEEISRLIAKQEATDADLVYGIPKHRKHGFIRIAGSYFVRKSSKVSQGNSEGSSFRIIKKSLALQIEKHQHKSMIYIDEIFSWYTNNIASTEVEHHSRKYGRSGYTTGKLIRVYLDIVINHSAVPLKLMTWFGLLSSLVTLILGVFFIVRKYLHNVPVGFTALIVTILFSASILMMCLGILGQYLNKLYLLQNRRPSFYIRELR